MESEEKQFYVLLAIFGGIFGVGPFLAFEANGIWTAAVGCVLTFLGLVGLLMLADRFRQWARQAASRFRIRIPLPLLGVIGVWILLAVFLSYLHGLRSDFNAYAMPRQLTVAQKRELGRFLSAHGSDATVHVFVNVSDREALEYAGQIFNAIRNGGWRADFRPINPWEPDNPKQHERALSNMILVLDSGLEIRTCIPGQPVNPDPKHQHPTPDALLGEAFRDAHVDVNGGGGSADCGDYSVNVLVEHRPVVIGDREPLLRRIGRGIERLSY